MGRTGNADGAAGDDTPLLPPSFSSDPQALPAPVVS
jgi:hypothetical protein